MRGDLIKVLDAALVKERREELQKKVDEMWDKGIFDESTRNLYIELMKDETLIKDTEQRLNFKGR